MNELFDKEIFDKFRYTPKDFGFNVDSFIEIFLDDFKLKDICLYSYKCLPKFCIYTSIKNSNNFNLNLDRNVITFEYFNNKGNYHRFNNYAYKRILLLSNKSIIGAEKQYYLHGKLHNLKGPAFISHSNIYNNCYKYYIHGKEYSLNDYCKIISKRIGLLNE